MRTGAEIEADRLAAIAERDAEEPAWRDRYTPGTFGCHEALHATLIAQGVVSDALEEHGAILANPDWYRLAAQASDALGALYQAIGAVHLSAESEAS